MSNSKKFKLFTSLIAIVVLVNAYLLLRNNDVIEKSYYINPMQIAYNTEHTKELKKEGILSAKENVIIAMDVKDVDQIYVKRSEAVSAEQELVRFNPNAVDSEIQRLEIEVDAYEAELSELQSILSYLEGQFSSSSPSTATDSTSVQNNDILNLDLTLELGIDQGTSTAEGEAIIGRHIAETERQIDIANNMLTSLQTERALLSPIDGVIGDIMRDGQTLTFVIYPEEKSVITYIDEKQWQQVEMDQQAEIVIRKGTDEELVVEGSVIEKQQIPAEESIWYEEMLRYEKIDPDKTLYEVKIAPNAFLDEFPYGEKVDVTITTNEAFNSLLVHEDWVVEYEVEDIGEQHVYIVDYDGRTRLVPIDIAFNKKATQEEIDVAPVEEPLEEEPTLEDEVLEEEPVEEPKIQMVELAAKEDEDEEKEAPEKFDATVFTSSIEDGAILLDGSVKNIYAPTFRPYPLQTFKWENVGPLTAEDIIQFMFQP